jgi:uncharacterized protein
VIISIQDIIKNDMVDTTTLLLQAESLLLYRQIFADRIGRLVLDLWQSPDPATYSQWFCELADRNLGWQDYVFDRLITADNPFTRRIQQQDWKDLPVALQQAVEQDLRSIQQIYHQGCAATTQNMSVSWVDSITPPPQLAAAQLRTLLQQTPDWTKLILELIAYYRQWGTGIFAEFGAFRWQGQELHGIAAPDPIKLQNLVGYEWQQQALVQNTATLVAGYPAVNVLLYGSRGAGKSSLVKALLPEFFDRGLRLIEVPKQELTELPQILEKLRSLPQKFIIFVDDLSFEADENAFKALKVVLEGGVVARPANIVVYATSNRRHLIREFFADRPRPQDSDEIHQWDTVQEKLSFSDRFGLTLTFEPADQDTYLQIVRHLATDLEIAAADLEFRALQWATQQNGRSGRTARQFVDFLRGELRNTSS